MSICSRDDEIVTGYLQIYEISKATFVLYLSEMNAVREEIKNR